MNDDLIGLSLGILFLLVFGCVFFGVVWWQFRIVREKLKTCTAQVYGFITDFKMEYYKDQHGRKKRTYFPYVKFQPSGKEWRTVLHKCGTNPPAYEKGAHILVRYNPENPNEFALPVDVKVNPFVCYMFIGFGILCIGLAVILFVYIMGMLF